MLCPRYRTNPAWTNHALAVQWDEILRFAGPARMPKLTHRSAKELVAVEYGVGNYGAVLPTHTPGLVLKITSDASEAQFIQAMLELGQPAGLIPYHAIFRLEATRESGEPAHKVEHLTPTRRNPTALYILWRDEAFDVGSWVSQSEDVQRFVGKLHDYYIDANGLMLSFDHSGSLNQTRKKAISLFKSTYRGKGYALSDYRLSPAQISKHPEQSAAIAIEQTRFSATVMSKDPFGATVGKALFKLWDEGVVLADVHTGNIGRDRKDRLVVTDPGHAVFLTSRFDRVEPKLIESAKRGDWVR